MNALFLFLTLVMFLSASFSSRFSKVLFQTFHRDILQIPHVISQFPCGLNVATGKQTEAEHTANMRRALKKMKSCSYLYKNR